MSFRVGSGDSLVAIGGIDWDDSNNRLLVMEYDRLLAIDPATGNRTQLSGPDVGSGSDMGGSSAGLAFDSSNNLVWTIDRNNNRLMKFEIANAQRTALYDPPPTSDLPLGRLSDIKYDSSGNRLLTTDNQGAIQALAIDWSWQ